MASSFASLHAAPDAAELEAARTLQLAERAPASAGPVGLRARPPANAAELILGLQRTAGNSAVAQLLRASTARPGVFAHASVQRATDDDPSADGGQAGDEESVQTGETLPTPIAEGADAGGAAGTDSAAGGADTATDGAQAEAGATGQQAATGPDASGGGPDATGAASTDGGETATGAAESTASDEGEAAGAGTGSGETGDPATADPATGDGEHSQADQDAKAAEGEDITGTDERVPMEGGPPPSAVVGRFIDGGRRATVPFETATSSDPDPAEALVPHAYVGGGRTGGAAWAGGGPGKGPKGNQGTGSLQTESEPKYDTRGNGLRTNADVWVRAGTGIVDVKRDYITSDAGDQGNGWWISAKAAASLEAHEQRHVASAKEVYENKIQPVLDRVADSAKLGKGITYWSKDAVPLLQQKIGWKYALDQFKEADQQSNANQGIVDLNDYGSSHYPRNMKGPRKIAGKDYDNYLIMGDEPDPT